MVDVPIYLKECTKIKKVQKDAIILQVLCDCGCSSLYLLENILDEEEANIIKAHEKRFSKWSRIENYTDPITQIRYLVARNAFGRIFAKIPTNEIQDIRRTQIIKVECGECGRQLVIYDSRYHGYDAIVTKNQFSTGCKKYQYRLLQKKSMEVEIKIRNDLTYDEFCEESEENSIKEFSNAFSSIEIYGIKDGKKKKYFERETA